MYRLPIKTTLYGVVILIGICLVIIYTRHISASSLTNEIKSAVERNADEVKKIQIHSAYGKLPLSFIQNGGQVNNIIRLSSMKREAVMRLSSPKTGSI